MTAADQARHPQRNRKANPMTRHTASPAAVPPFITDPLRAAGRKLSDRFHAAGDYRARAAGWEGPPTPGPLGLRGRSYRDPRFDMRRSRQFEAARREGTS